jgi:tetratricopeptide (TPR) repeat protein
MELRPGFWVPRLFRLLGLLFLTSGIAWLAATRYEMSLPGGVGVENEMHKASAASQGRSFGEAIERTTRALEWAPLKWQLYFLRALAKVGAGRPPSQALDDFRRARFLEPNAYEVPYEEGVVWLAREPSLAITAWREALRRTGAQRPGVFEQMLFVSSQRSPTVHRGLEEIGMVHHDLALVYLQHSGGAEFTSALHRFLEQDPNLQTFSNEEKSRFFSLWGDRGDPEELARAVEAHPDWLDQAWRAMAKYHANRKDFQGAFRVVRRFGETPPMPEDAVRSSIGQLQQAFHAAPDNYGVGYQLYRQQMREGKIDEALQTVRHFTDLASSPRYFHFLEAEAWAAKENWERAWQAWEKFQTAKAK